MSDIVLTGDQAIFTSVRSPMGEGYRIIAASKGLKADEKQAITRVSPSHDALCAAEGEAREGEIVGVAFFPLPGGRLCLSSSCFAGAEHTGRGGMRVYTHHAVFDAETFARAGFNPFRIHRALAASGVVEPQLKPPTALPDLEITLTAFDARVAATSQTVNETARWGRFALFNLFSGGKLVVNMPGDWLSTAETLFLALPGPMRREISFGAGLKFSVGRGHALQLLHDEKGTAKARLSGPGVCLFDPVTDTPTQSETKSAWLDVVDRHWKSGDLNGLDRRTARPFPDVSPEGRERVGRMYVQIDAMPGMEPSAVLGHVVNVLELAHREVEADIAEELLQHAQRTLLNRFAQPQWDAKGAQTMNGVTASGAVNAHWPTLLTIWRRNERGTRFAEPIIAHILRGLVAGDTLAALTCALDVARDLPKSVDVPDHTGMLDDVLQRSVQRLAAQLARSGDPAEPTLVAIQARGRELGERWRQVRPSCPIVQQLQGVVAGPSMAAGR